MKDIREAERKTSGDRESKSLAARLGFGFAPFYFLRFELAVCVCVCVFFLLEPIHIYASA